MVSVICVYNNSNILESMLMKSLEKQKSCGYELIALDNTLGKYESAAKALNYGASKAKGEDLVFVHQDVEWDDSYLLQKTVNYLRQFDGKVIVGAAGIIDSIGVYTNLSHGDKKILAGPNKILEPKRVLTLDEVLISTSKTTFNELKFDECTCNDWHLYVVDLCLSAILNQIPSFVIPLDIYHKSSGKLSLGYFNTLWKVAQKHKNENKIIYTTCSTFKTSNPELLTYIYTNKLKLYMKSSFPKSSKILIGLKNILNQNNKIY